jgi:hypothetical protein
LKAFDAFESQAASDASHASAFSVDFFGGATRHRRKVLEGGLWSPSYFAANCGGARIGISQEYIEQQKARFNFPRRLAPYILALKGGVLRHH